MSIPHHTRASVIPEPHSHPVIQTYPIPQLAPGEALLRVVASEVCGTDVHLKEGRLSGVPFPLIPGHVSVGEIVAVSSPLYSPEGTAILPGMQVAFLDVFDTCHHCLYCTVWKTSTRCPHRKVYGITVGANETPGLGGGWSEYMILRAGTLILPLAPKVTPDIWIGAGCGLPTAMHAIELASIRIGDRVLIQGSGPVGLSACALALLSGAGWVGVIGAPAERLAEAQRMGADFTIDVTATTPQERRERLYEALNGYGPDIVIEASGSTAAIQEGCELIRDCGRYVVVGQYTDNGSISLNPHLHINKKHLSIQGCWGCDFSHVFRAMQTLDRFNERIRWDKFISHRYSLEETGQALIDVEQRSVVKAVIIP